MSEKADVKKLIAEIKKGLDNKTSSQKDEIRVMKEMLNDRDYKVGVYTKKGKEGELCPSAEAREMISSVLNSAAKISKDEAAKLADDHEFDNKESANLINVSKEFINTYVQTNRRLPLGGREKTSTMLQLVTSPDVTGPKKVRVATDKESGKPIIREVIIHTPEFQKLKANSTCPDWLKDKNKAK